MARHRPWYKRSGGDFVMGTLGMPDSDHKWAYSAIVDMLNDRDRALPDDPAFICGFTGLSRKKWSIVRRYLIEHDKLVELPGGYLSNPRFEDEHRERADEHERAVKHGREGGKRSAARRRQQGELDLSREDRPDYRPDKQPESHPDAHETQDTKRQKTATSDEPPPQATRARKRPREESYKRPNTQDSKVEDDDRSAADDPVEEVPTLRDRDLKELVDALTEAAGFQPRTPGSILREFDIVKGWKADGLDFDEIVLPVIRDEVSKSSDPTSSLLRFDRRVRYEHARRKATKDTGHAYRPPPSPVLEPEDEDPRFRPLRAQLLKRLGPTAYSTYANDVRFVVADAADGRKVLRVKDERSGSLSLMDAGRESIVRGLAKRMGFEQVW